MPNKPICLQSIVGVAYNTSDNLKPNEAEILLYVDGLVEPIDATKPVLVVDMEKPDQPSYFLKIPNPRDYDQRISIVEAGVAAVTRDLLSNYGVVVPQYKVIELPLVPGLDKTTTLACLVEALNFRSFGSYGTDIVVDEKRVKFNELSEEKQTIRLRQLEILKSDAFLAYNVVMFYIANNDPHQDNFGTITKEEIDPKSGCKRVIDIRGETNNLIIAALDFDMAVMPLLIAEGIYGPRNAGYEEEGDYHNDHDGRFSTPMDRSFFERFPDLDTGRSTPDNWPSDWAHGLGEFIKKYYDSRVNNLKRSIFEKLANLDKAYFANILATRIPYSLKQQHPEVEHLNNKLINFFVDASQKLKLALSVWVDERLTLGEQVTPARVEQVTPAKEPGPTPTNDSLMRSSVYRLSSELNTEWDDMVGHDGFSPPSRAASTTVSLTKVSGTFYSNNTTEATTATAATTTPRPIPRKPPAPSA